MPYVKKSTVVLRVYGKELVPAEITALLGPTPSRQYTARENKLGKVGMWQLAASPREPADIDGQIQELLNQVAGDPAVWRAITDKYQADLFFCLFMGERNEGVIISADSMAALGARGIRVGLDIYGGVDKKDDTNAS